MFHLNINAMDKKKMLSELVANSKAKNTKLLDLLKVYELACIGNSMQEQRSKDAYNQVLKENEFYAENDCPQANIKKGDRITDETCDFLLSDSDAEKLSEKAVSILVENKITNEDGYYLEDWLGMETKARKELVDFWIKEIVPKCLRETLWEEHLNYVYQMKYIKLIKQGLGIEAA